MGLLIIIAVFFTMEGLTWLIHRYIMHGLLWTLHRDHHDHSNKGHLERNDYFFVIFATPGIALLWFGLRADFNYLFWLGLGITIYGFTYFLVHDVFIHQRFKMFRNTDSVYLRAIRRAHKMHHKHLGKYQGECFGMLWVPLKYFREAKNAAAK